MIDFQIVPYKDYNKSLEIIGYQVVARFGSKVEAEITKSFLENLLKTGESVSIYLERFKRIKNEFSNEKFSIAEIIVMLKSIKEGRTIIQ